MRYETISNGPALGVVEKRSASNATGGHGAASLRKRNWGLIGTQGKLRQSKPGQPGQFDTGWAKSCVCKTLMRHLGASPPQLLDRLRSRSITTRRIASQVVEIPFSFFGRSIMLPYIRSLMEHAFGRNGGSTSGGSSIHILSPGMEIICVYRKSKPQQAQGSTGAKCLPLLLLLYRRL